MAKEIVIERLVAEVDIKTGDLNRKVAALEAKLDALFRDRDAEVDVEADMPPRSAVAAQVAATFGGHNQTVRMKVSKASLGNLTKGGKVIQKLMSSVKGLTASLPGLAMGFLKIGTLITGITLLVGHAITAIMALGAALTALLGTLKQVGALFAVIPHMIGTAIQAMAGFKAILSGVTEAIGAGSAKRKNQGGGGGLSVQDKARMLEDAQRRVRDAEVALQDAKENSAFIETEVAEAEEYLNEVRAQAIELTDDYRLAVERLAYSEKQASANVSDARRNLEAVRADPNATARDRRDALLALEDAEIRLKETQDARSDTEQELARREKDGVDGTDEVVAALEWQKGLQDATRDSAYALADAETELKRSKEDLAKVEKGDFGGGGVDNFAMAMKQLPKLTQKFVNKIVNDLLPALEATRKKMQEIFFGGGGDELLDAFINLLPAIDSVGVATAEAFSGVASDLAAWIDTDKFREDFEFLGLESAGHIETLGDALVDVLKGMTDFAVAAAPFTKWVVDGFAKMAEAFAEWARLGREDGSLAAFFEESKPILLLWKDVFKNIGKMFGGIFRAAAPFAKSLLESFAELTERAADWTNSKEGTKRLRAWFDAMRPILSMLGKLTGTVSVFFAKFSEKNAGAFVKFGDFINDVAGPALGRFFDYLAESSLQDDLISIVTSLGTLFGMLLTLGLPILETIIPALADFLELIVEIAQSPLVKIAIEFGLVALSISKLIGIFKLLIPAGAALGITLSGGLLVAIVAVAAAAYLIYRNWDTIWPKIKEIWEKIASLAVEVWNGIVDFFRDVFDGNWRDAWQAIIDFHSTIAQLIWNAIGPIGEWLWNNAIKPALTWLKDNWLDILWEIVKFHGTVGMLILEALGDLGSWLWEQLKVGMGKFVTQMMLAVDSIVGWFKGLPSRILALIPELISGMAELGRWMVGALVSAFEAINFTAIKDAIFSAASSLGGWIVDGIATGISAAGSAVWDAIKALLPPGFGSVIGGIGGFLGDLGGWLGGGGSDMSLNALTGSTINNNSGGNTTNYNITTSGTVDSADLMFYAQASGAS